MHASLDTSSIYSPSGQNLSKRPNFRRFSNILRPPSSTLLFALDIGPLDVSIWTSSTIKGLLFGTIEEFVPMVYLADPSVSLYSLFLQVITEFENESGFRVNRDKFSLFPLDSAAT